MALATATPGGRPSVRMVLLKGLGPDGFVFYTNADSRKGEDLAANPHAALAVSLEIAAAPGAGRRPVTEVSANEADSYFATRSRDLQLGAWASDQSRPLASRAAFEERYEAAKRRYEGRDVPRPERWTGFRVVPDRIEYLDGPASPPA